MERFERSTYEVLTYSAIGWPKIGVFSVEAIVEQRGGALADAHEELADRVAMDAGQALRGALHPEDPALAPPVGSTPTPSA
ncbi:MAG TPA: hypothetical protein VFT22_44235 [Kofleriaceae bacterium]|nr:hypothetical protein [Kofleriaceae bacterium]